MVIPFPGDDDPPSPVIDEVSAEGIINEASNAYPKPNILVWPSRAPKEEGESTFYTRVNVPSYVWVDEIVSGDAEKPFAFGKMRVTLGGFSFDPDDGRERQVCKGSGQDLTAGRPVTADRDGHLPSSAEGACSFLMKNAGDKDLEVWAQWIVSFQLPGGDWQQLFNGRTFPSSNTLQIQARDVQTLVVG